MLYEYHCPHCGKVSDWVSQCVCGHMHYYEDVTLDVDTEEFEYDNYESDFGLDRTEDATVTFSCPECGSEFWSGPYDEAYAALKMILIDDDPNKSSDITQIGQ